MVPFFIDKISESFSAGSSNDNQNELANAVAAERVRFFIGCSFLLLLLIILGIAIPAIELFLLYWLAGIIGFWQTIGIIVGTGVLGAVLWKWQGFGVFGRLRSGLMQGVDFGDTLLDGAMIFFAGGLLLTPGILTDLVGFLLLIPFTRTIFKKMVMSWLKKKFNVFISTQMQQMDLHSMMQQESSDEEDDIIEGEIVSRKDFDVEKIEDNRGDA